MKRQQTLQAGSVLYGSKVKKNKKLKVVLFVFEIAVSTCVLYFAGVLDYFFGDLIFISPSASGLFVFLFSKNNISYVPSYKSPHALWIGTVSIIFVIFSTGISLSGSLIMLTFLAVISLFSSWFQHRESVLSNGNSFGFLLIMVFYQLIMLNFTGFQINFIQFIPVFAVFILSFLSREYKE